MNRTIDMVVVNYRSMTDLLEFSYSLSMHPPLHTEIGKLSIMDVDPMVNFEGAIFNSGGCNYHNIDWNCGYSHACNLAAMDGESDVIAFFNADTKFLNHSVIDLCVDFLEKHPEVGIVGPLQVRDFDVVTASGFFGDPKEPSEPGFKSNNPSAYRENKKAVYVSGSALFIKRDVWNELKHCPIYNSSFPDSKGAMLPTFLYYEDRWLCRHAEAHGFETWFLGEAVMFHKWHGSTQLGGMAKYVKPARLIYEKACHDHNIIC